MDFGNLDNYHCIPITIKSVFLSDRFLVGFFHQCGCAEGVDEHQQGAFGEMEVSDEDVGHFEFISWSDEDIGFFRERTGRGLTPLR